MGKRLTKLPLSFNDHGHLHDNSMGKSLHGVLTTTASGRPCMAIGVITISELLKRRPERARVRILGLSHRSTVVSNGLGGIGEGGSDRAWLPMQNAKLMLTTAAGCAGYSLQPAGFEKQGITCISPLHSLPSHCYYRDFTHRSYSALGFQLNSVVGQLSYRD